MGDAVNKALKYTIRELEGEDTLCPYGVSCQTIQQNSDFLQAFTLSDSTAIVGGVVCAECPHFEGNRNKEAKTIECSHPGTTKIPGAASEKKSAAETCPQCSAEVSEETTLYVTYACGSRFAKELSGSGRYCITCQ